MARFARSLSALVVLLGTLAAGASQARSAPSSAHVLFAFSDQRITEASGIARGLRSPGVYYVQNDSGDRARFFAIDAATGRTVAVYSVPGATNVDWEDLAVARDSRGVPSVYLADTGDNDGVRTEVRIYRVDEPAVDLSRAGAEASTGAPAIWRLTYPGGPRDVEALAVSPGGQMYLMDKRVLGPTDVYRVPPRPDPAHRQVVALTGRFDTTDTATPGGPNALGRLTVTGAAISPDGQLLVVRTYTDAYLWRLGSDGVTGALRRRPTLLALPSQLQGEGIAMSGRQLVIDSEGVGASVWAVPVPAPLLPPPPTPATPSSVRVAPLTPTSAAPGPVASGGAVEPGSSAWPAVRLGLISAVIAVGVGGALLRYRSRRRR